jgi:hypothetical protein
MLQLALEWKQKLEYILELDLETILTVMDILNPDNEVPDITIEDEENLVEQANEKIRAAKLNSKDRGNE